MGVSSFLTYHRSLNFPIFIRLLTLLNFIVSSPSNNYLGLICLPGASPFLELLVFTPSHRLSEIVCRVIANSSSLDIYDFSMPHVHSLSLLAYRQALFIQLDSSSTLHVMENMAYGFIIVDWLIWEHSWLFVFVLTTFLGRVMLFNFLMVGASHLLLGIISINGGGTKEALLSSWKISWDTLYFLHNYKTTTKLKDKEQKKSEMANQSK